MLNAPHWLWAIHPDARPLDSDGRSYPRLSMYHQVGALVGACVQWCLWLCPHATCTWQPPDCPCTTRWGQVGVRVGVLQLHVLVRLS